MERDLELAFGMTEQDYLDRMDFGRDADEELDDLYGDEVDEDERYMGDDPEDFPLDEGYEIDPAEYEAAAREDFAYGGWEFETPEFDE